tara:strand:- start:701 stop:1444 length:744 start_codon:yes stop_codon:yes gene_type:complete
MIQHLDIDGIKFINGDFQFVWSKVKKGGLLVAPAAPAIKDIKKNQLYYNSLKNSDFAIVDSGFMVLFLFLFRRIKLKKLSGLSFLKSMLKQPEIKIQNSIFLINPNNKESLLNSILLNSHGIKLKEDYQYVAPIYNSDTIEDIDLLKILNRKKPNFILINIGGGKQEPLGSYLKNNISFSSSIICTGAAISFINGTQAKIPYVIDKLFLGWLSRIISNPKIFLPRYINALKVVKVLWNAKIEIKHSK